MVVWADLQGAMTAGIVLSRLLRPAGVRARPGMNASESQRRSSDRGKQLRSLLAVEDDSPLLALGRVRDPLEHIDERLDRVIEDPNILSVSDLYIAPDVFFSENEAGSGGDVTEGIGHRNLRTFLPLQGVLMYGDQHVDLFVLETELHKLLSNLPDARDQLESRRRPTSRTYGSSRPRCLDTALVHARRNEIARFREEQKEQIALNMMPIHDPGEVILALLEE